MERNESNSRLSKLIPFFAGVLVSAQTLQVCTTCNFKTIKDAVSAAHTMSKIVIQPGTYKENSISLDRPLEIIGEGFPTVDGEKKNDIFIVASNNVKISGLKLINSGFSYLKDMAAIRVSEVDGCSIENNILTDNFFAIHLARTHNCKILNNKISGPRVPEDQQGNGIHIWSSSNNVISNNDISGHRDGIYFEFVKDTLIIKNRSHNNARYGLHFMFSDGDSYLGNIFSENGAGVAVMYSKNIKMESNVFEKSYGGSTYGLLLKDIDASTIHHNKFINNSTGIYMEGSNRSQFTENDFSSDGWALRILGSCDSNTFYHNNFISNSFDVSTNSTNNFNEFNENFWSSYQGLDLNRDGVGDSPFRPVRLSSILAEKYGLSILLLRSFFFSIIDEAEASFPVLTPEKLQDQRPLMRKVKW